MRIHLIKKQSIQNFILNNATAKSYFEDWLSKIKYADWKTPRDIKSTFSTVDLLGKSSNRVVFDIGGNNYRMICKYAFGDQYVHLFICWIGTHSSYNKLCGTRKQYTINNY
jgi:mRNA interferase HigB